MGHRTASGERPVKTRKGDGYMAKKWRPGEPGWPLIKDSFPGKTVAPAGVGSRRGGEGAEQMRLQGPSILRRGSFAFSIR